MADAAARALSMPIDDHDRLSPTRSRTSMSPSGWTRRSPTQSGMSHRPKTAIAQWLRSARQLRDQGQSLFFSLTPLQRAGVIIVSVILFTTAILFLIFNERIFQKITPLAESWREMRGGWMILWAAVFLVSFPPLIGYSSLVLIAGFVWGMKGWLIVASATIVGSTVAFLVSRTLLKKFVSRLAEKNKRFAALALVLKHDGLKLLVMIRLCPLPYSLSNGAVSTISTVTWYNFMLATALVSPRLLLHVFVGSEIGRLARDGGKMDAKTRAISYASIALGVTMGATVGYIIYTRTKARAEELETEEGSAANENPRSGDHHRRDYIDGPAEREAVNLLKQRDDDVSLHTTYGGDHEDVERGYQDEFSNDEDAEERNVFNIGEGELSDDEDQHSDR